MVSLISISAQAFSVQAEHTGICTYTTLQIGSYQEEFVFFFILFSEKLSRMHARANGVLYLSVLIFSRQPHRAM